MTIRVHIMGLTKVEILNTHFRNKNYIIIFSIYFIGNVVKEIMSLCDGHLLHAHASD